MFHHDNSSFQDPVRQREKREELLNKLADLEHDRVQALKDKDIQQQRRRLQRTQSLPPLPSSSLYQFVAANTPSTTDSGPSLSRHLSSLTSSEADKILASKDDQGVELEDRYERSGGDAGRFVGHRGNAGLIFETRHFRAPGLDVTDLYPHLKEQADAKKKADAERNSEVDKEKHEGGGEPKEQAVL